MSNIKLIAIDIGGSLLADNNCVPIENIQSIKSVKEIGTKIALATARMYSSTKYISKAIESDYGVFSNGSVVMDLNYNKTFTAEYLSLYDVYRLIDLAKSRGLYIHINCLKWELSDQMEFFTLKHIMLNKNYPDELKSNIILVSNLKEYLNDANDIVKVVFVSEKKLNDLYSIVLKRFPHLFITEYFENSKEPVIGKTVNYLEVGNKPVTKADGLKKLAKELKINEDDILVIGDGKNDIELFTEFKNSACVANAQDNIKKLCRYVAKRDNNHAGVAEIINNIMR